MLGHSATVCRHSLIVALSLVGVATPISVSFHTDGADKVSSDLLGPYKWHPEKYWPSVFVAIFSRRSAGERRARIRTAWQRADFGQGKLLTRFAICDDGSDEDGLTDELRDESGRYGDLLLMQCREGYGRGLLTKKTLCAMEAYANHEAFSSQQLFMKIDDDTFAAWSRLWPIIARSWENHTDNIFMGTLKPEGKPTRDPFNAFYEPRDIYPREVYPMSADGGPGYIIGGMLVRQIVREHIADNWLLYNEDKAVAVWMDGLLQRGQEVNYVNIEGQTGYATSEKEWEGQLRWFHKGRWVCYPLVLHHRLSGDAIECLSKVEATKDPNATIDGCFSATDNTWIPMAFMRQAEAMGHELWLRKYASKKYQNSFRII